MSLIVDGGQALKVKMSVNLSRGKVGVAQQLLHGTKFTTGLQQMAGERVAQHVGVNRLAELAMAAVPVKAGLYRAWTDATAKPAEKQGLCVCGLDRPRALLAHRQPLVQGSASVAPHGNLASARALAEDSYQTLGEIQVIGIQGNQFRQSQAGRVEQFDHGAITSIQPSVAMDLHELCRGIRVQKPGQPMGAFRRRDAVCRVVIDLALPREILV